MSTNTKTLDERIRAQALAELSYEVKKSLDPIKSLLAIGHSLDIPVKPNSHGTCNAHSLLDAIETAVIAAHREDRESRAIKQFIDKVDSLQDQVEELRQIGQGA